MSSEVVRKTANGHVAVTVPTLPGNDAPPTTANVHVVHRRSRHGDHVHVSVTVP